jgi:hypothetical protein
VQSWSLRSTDGSRAFDVLVEILLHCDSGFKSVAPSTPMKQVLGLLAALGAALAYNNGLGSVPPLGWSTVRGACGRSLCFNLCKPSSCPDTASWGGCRSSEARHVLQGPHVVVFGTATELLLAVVH